MRPPRNALLPLLLVSAALLAGCPAESSAPCSADSECEPGRCRNGACGPECEFDLDCGAGESCVAGTCGPVPQCLADTDCAAGFTCSTEQQCRCTGDSACAANEACLQGACRDRPACSADADCASYGLLCERSSGQCVPPCQLPANCAPGLDPNLASLLYVCDEGACLQRCLGDATCGSGLLCRDGLCSIGECDAREDCGADEYCTAGEFGECLAYTPCETSAQCPQNFGCSSFPTSDCPPGVDCAVPACRELPSCLIDTDCPQPAFCADRHCQESSSCSEAVPCDAGRECVGGACVPALCRGQHDCGAEETCSDGACVPLPALAELQSLTLTAEASSVGVGDTLQLTVMAERTGAGTFHRIPAAEFSITDASGAPSSAVTVSPSGVLVAVAPGRVRVVAGLAGSALTSPALELQLVAAAVDGETLALVVDGATFAPLAGIRVTGCATSPTEADCPDPQEVITGADGVAVFAFQSSDASFSAASSQVRADGFPAYDRTSIVGTGGRTVVIPLWPNRIHADAATSASFDFSASPGEGSWWLGLAVGALPSLEAVEPRALLGEPFVAQLPGTQVRPSLPGALTLLFQGGPFGAPLQLRQPSYLRLAPGRRRITGFGGRVDAPANASFAGTSLLQYVGALGISIAPPESFPHRPWIADASDLDGDGLCFDAGRCSAGVEDLPEYLADPAAPLRPDREQRLRTRISVGPLPSPLDSVLVAQVSEVPGEGLTPLGLSSMTAGTAAIVLRSATAAAGLEAGAPALVAIATRLDASGLPTGAHSLRREPAPDAEVTVAPFLPLPGGSDFSSFDRTVTPALSSWSALASAGASVGRFSLRGPDSRHLVYFHVQAVPTSVRIPQGPAGAGSDAGGSALAVLEETALALQPGVNFDDAFDLPGPSPVRPGGLAAAVATSP